MRGRVTVMTNLVDALDKDKVESGEQVFNNSKLNMKARQPPWDHIKRLSSLAIRGKSKLRTKTRN